MEFRLRLVEEGPAYPNLGPAVAKWRRNIGGPIAAAAPFARYSYGEAIGKAVRALQVSELRRAYAPPPLNKVGLTLVGRLSRYDSPPRMAGDPPFRAGCWQSKAETVYAQMMQQKRAQL